VKSGAPEGYFPVSYVVSRNDNKSMAYSVISHDCHWHTTMGCQMIVTTNKLLKWNL